MAGTALLGRLTWQLADVVDVVEETPRVKTIVLDVSDWAGHRAGQHVDIRLTAEDGYQAERRYSIASAPDGTRIELTVERLDDGEVSPYLTDELRPGDRIELRGPIGGYFIWEPSQDGPVLLAAGGSGVVPLMAMARARAVAGSQADMRLVLSSRSCEEIIYRAELERLSGDGFTRRPHAHALATFRLDRLCASRRLGDARGRRPEPGRASERLRLRPDAVRRGRGEGTRRARARPEPRQDGTVRTNGRLRW